MANPFTHTVCGPCHINNATCRQNQLLNGSFEPWKTAHSWCKCLPIRACVTLYIADEYDEDQVVALAYVEHDCDETIVPFDGHPAVKRPSYGGNLSYGGNTIDVQFWFTDDEYGQLWCFLASTALGYADDGSGNDTRPSVPMGGEYDEVATKITNCNDLGLSFDIDLSPLSSELGSATITLDAADLIHPDIGLCPTCGVYAEDGPTCYCSKVCLTYEELDEYGTVTYREMVKACVQDGGSGANDYWEGQFRDDLVHTVVQLVPDESAGVLSFTAVEVYGEVSFEPDSGQETQEAYCPSGVSDWPNNQTGNVLQMYAAWAGTVTDGSDVTTARLILQGDPRYKCGDCTCFNRCLCVRYSDYATGNAYVGEVCWTDEYGGGWVGSVGLLIWDSNAEQWTNDEYSSQAISIDLVCDQCTGVTSLRMSGFDETYPLTGLCPDIEGYFAKYDDQGELEASASVTPATCGQCDLNAGTYVECCEDQVPTALYITLTPDGACPQEAAPIELIAPWTRLGAEGNSPVSYEPQAGTGWYAYVSEYFTISGRNTRFRFFIAPCQDGGGCDYGEITWEAWLVTEYWPDENTAEPECQIAEQFFSCEPDCTAVLITGYLLCQCDVADAGGYTIAITG